jgi:hypothetical protein
VDGYADARGTEAVKLSVKLLSGLTLIALVTVAVIGLSHSASAAADAKVYITNEASKLTTEPGQTIDPDGRLTASTVYGTYASAITTGTSARDIVANSDVFIVTVIDSDLNATTTVTADQTTGAGYDLGLDGTGLENSNIIDAGGSGASGLDNITDIVTVIMTDEVTNPIVGALGDIKFFRANTDTVVTGISAHAILLNGDGVSVSPAIQIIQSGSSLPYTGLVDITYPSSAIDTTTASIKSVVDTTGSVLTLTETGRNTGRFEGFVQVSARTATFTTGVDGAGTSIGAAATVAAIGGPITVKYNDVATSGSATNVSRTETLAIDVTVPTATISTPSSGSETQNRLPSFTGTVTDNQSGLDVSEFALYIDLESDQDNDDLIISAGASNAGLPTINGGVAAASIDVSSLSDGVSSLPFSYTQTVVLPNVGVTNPDHIVDFQVRASDLAGNYGYSDSNTALGNEESSGRHGNQPHTIKIDQIIPQISSAEFGIGLDQTVSPSKDKANVNDAIKVTFDGKLDDDSIEADHFKVTLSGSGGVHVPASYVLKDNVVYLDIDVTIPSDNTPTVAIIKLIQDLAGNSTDSGSAVASDELAPIITVTQSAGSGTGTGAEGADQLTADKLTITVSSDENLQGPPAITVTDLVTTPSVGNVNDGTLGVAQGSNTWTLVITKGASSAGDRAVKVTATDSAGNTRTSPSADGDTTKTYRLDLIVDAPTSTPEDTGSTTQARPFLTTDYGKGGEKSTVTITEATLDGVALRVVDDPNDSSKKREIIPSADGKTFFFQPVTDLTDALHTYVIKAVDAAGNKLTTTTKFTKKVRSDFVLELFAGWNAVSVPSTPGGEVGVANNGNSVSDVFSNTGILQVIRYNALTPSTPWSIASKAPGASTFTSSGDSLTTVDAGTAYWVETANFEDQKISLEGPTGPGDARPGLITIPTADGWNFVGVVDQSRTQTQAGNKGASLTRPNATGTDVNVTSATYFNTVNNGRAYTFNTVSSEFRELVGADAVTIGSGIWVFISAQDNGELPHIVP